MNVKKDPRTMGRLRHVTSSQVQLFDCAVMQVCTRAGVMMGEIIASGVRSSKVQSFTFTLMQVCTSVQLCSGAGVHIRKNDG